MVTTTPGMAKDLDLISQSFARGVCSALRARGAEVSPGWLGRAEDHRSLLRSSMRIVRYSRSVLLCVLVPAIVASLVLGRDRVGTALVVGCWIGWLSLLPLYVRWRVIGAKAWMLVVFIAIVSVAMGVMTPVFVLDWMGRL
jgi:hypothetical protein